MLLRRIIRHAQQQSWTATTIDFLIVLPGVFVGLQVDNWNLDRLDAQRAHGYLLRKRSEDTTYRELLNAGDLGLIRNEALLDCESPISDADAQAVLDAYLAVPDLLPELRFWITTQESGTLMLASLRGTAQALLAQVQGELGK